MGELILRLDEFVQHIYSIPTTASCSYCNSWCRRRTGKGSRNAIANSNKKAVLHISFKATCHEDWRQTNSASWFQLTK